jgi:hypothetical protein
MNKKVEGRDMKKQFIIIGLSVLLIIISTNPVSAQQDSSLDKYWVQTGFGGSPEGISFAFGAGLQSDRFIGTAKIESSSQLLFAESSALAASLLAGISLQKPSYDSERNFSVNLQAGVGTFTHEECVQNCGILSSEEPKNARERTLSFPINAQMLVGISENLAFGLDGGVHFNPIKIYPSFHFTLLVGKLR